MSNRAAGHRLVVTRHNRAINRVRRQRAFEDRTRLLEAGHPAATIDEIDLADSTIRTSAWS
jgi:hypothetical protein